MEAALSLKSYRIFYSRVYYVLYNITQISIPLYFTCTCKAFESIIGSKMKYTNIRNDVDETLVNREIDTWFMEHASFCDTLAHHLSRENYYMIYQIRMCVCMGVCFALVKFSRKSEQILYRNIKCEVGASYCLWVCFLLWMILVKWDILIICI